VTLHVTNGESAGSTLRRTGLDGSVLAWNDVLHEGPIPPVPPDELREVRARFISDAGWGSLREVSDDLAQRDRLFADADHVVLWFEHDLYDQLQLLQVLDRVRESQQVDLIVVGLFLGSLAADQLAALWPARRRATPAQLALAREAWAAVRASTPLPVMELLRRDTSALPFLGDALRRLLEELPDTRSGLSRTERQVLELLAAQPRSPEQLFLASQELEEAPFYGDTWFYRCVAGLGTLIARPGAELVLTDDGRRVLAGDADRIELLGIDRWLGGVHLRTDDHWRWDGERAVHA
jgi:Domain of unknown function (DUF1835)